MVARKSRRRQDKMTREREDLVRRSPILSSGAKLLWIELIRGWAWNDSTCYPGQDVLSEALGVSKRSIQRWTAELIGHGLLDVRKTQVGNFYSIPDKLPEDICPADRLNNRFIVKLAGDANLTPSSRQPGASHDANLAAQEGSEATIWRPQSRQSGVSGDANMAAKDEYIEDEHREDELNTGATSRAGNLRDSEEIDDLLNEEVVEPAKMKRKKKKKVSKKSASPAPRSKRSAQKALVGVEGSLAQAHRNAVAGSEYKNAGPPPPTTPKDLLELLRSEIREKYGAPAARALDSDPTGKDSKSCKTTVLSKFDPDITVKMVRVLVWDWEMVRTQYPPAPLVKHPRLEHLVRYRAILSTSVDTGVDYDQKLRGSPNSYANRFLDNQKSKYDSKIDPY